VSDVPDRPTGPDDEDPFAGLPPELRAMMEQLGGPDALAQAQEQLQSLLGGGGAPQGFGFQPPTAPTGPVDWQLASRVALQLAAENDRGPTDEEQRRAEEAFALAEHWLDGTPLPAPTDAGRVVVGSRQNWVNAALLALRPFIEPVARASTDGMIKLAQEQFEELKDRGELFGEEGLAGLEGIEGLPPGLLDNLPPGLEKMIEQLMGQDPGAMLRPAGAALAGLQAGQVIGQLAHQLTGQYDLGIPTAPRDQAHHLAVNVAEDLEGYGLDLTEVAIVLALTEAAHRRLYHAVPWLEAHVHGLVAQFAAGTVVDARRLQELSEELMTSIDPDDPDSLRAAMEQAAGLRLEPTDEQRRILERLQGVVCLIGAWARHEVDRAVEGRIPSLDRIQEVLRRRRASRGDGEQLLEGLLGLDLKPDDESVGEAFVGAVEGALGPAGLHRALAHPENLPDAEELAAPERWLARTSEDTDVPDDASALFGELGDAPVEASADERVDRDAGDDQPDDASDDGDGDGDDPSR
jgi:putative hydrolase